MYRCKRCGAELTNKIIKINGVMYCENCARAMGYDRFLDNPAELMGSAFSPMDELAANFMKLADLDFGSSTVTCPKCGMKLRDYENKGMLGCIECYNAFNDYVVKEMFRQQGESEYAGRMPGKFVASEDIEKAMLTDGKENKGEENKAPASDSKSASAVKNAGGTPAADTANTEQDNKLAKLEKADIGMLSDAELEDGIRLATASEKYQLAIKFRDELKGRKAGE